MCQFCGILGYNLHGENARAIVKDGFTIPVANGEFTILVANGEFTIPVANFAWNGSGTGAVSNITGVASDFGEAELAWNGSGTGTTANTTTGNQDINGLLSSFRWNTTTISFSFPTLASQYGSYSHLVSGVPRDETTTFVPVNAQMANAARWVLSNALGSTYSSVSLLNLTENAASPGSATLRIGMSDSAQPTAYAYYPSGSFVGGDIWMGTQAASNVMTSPTRGNYAFHTMMHEIGHALGLKHGQETGGPANVAMTAGHDAMEYSVMTYRSYVGGPTTGYTNEQWGYAQSLMMYDIAAIQAMYGARFNATPHTYSWSPTTGEQFINGVGQGAPGGNRVFMTVWESSGAGVYDFSNYTTGMTIDLTPGGYSTLSAVQLANLGNGNMAHGNVYNALEYNNDIRSLIKTVYAGIGNDTITGNRANNVFYGGGGVDTINGGSGRDISVFNFAYASAVIVHNANGSWTITGPGQVETLTNVEIAQFTDRSVSLREAIRHDFNNNGTSDLLLRNSSGAISEMLMQNGSVTSWNVIASAPGWSIIDTGDFNNDGTSDILFQNSAGTVSEMLMQNGAVTSWKVVGTAPGWLAVDAGDFNNDGTFDVLLQNSAGLISEMLMQDGAVTNWNVVANAPGWTVIDTGDFNQDGTSDILLQNSAGLISEMLMQNGAVMSWNVVANAPGWTLIGTGDFNYDGTSDLLLQNSAGTVSEMLMQNGAVMNWNVVANAPGWTVIDAGDVNNDGTADILLQNSAGLISEMLMQNGAVTNWNVPASAGSWTLIA